ncbi:MAG: putative DNA binding domain-containing protein [Microscillaceae bacterium]|nr:putative DNA binding domain-containing protein [Microscillaceae bacterium]
MEASELLNLISGGETSTLQLKENVTNVVSIAQEMVAFSNSKGGKILIGVNDKTGEITGLSFQDIQRINNLLTTAANEHVKSAIIIETETVDVQGKKVIVTHISEGIDKPYMDKDGLIFIKNGSDKRKVTSKEELSRLLQSSGNLYVEEILIANSSYEDVHVYRFEEFYTQKYKLPFEKENLGDLIENLNLGKEGKLNLAGALLFTRHSQRNIPAFFITAIWFRGNDLWETNYLSSNNFVGTLSEQYEKAYAFVTNAMTKLQAGQSFNSLGKSEIPEIVIQELLTNALIHRDYFIKDTIKVFIFQNRVEIKSPGKLPNNLTEEQIKRGIRKKRNPILDSFAPDLLNYRGAGSGILRALQAYPHIDFINDREAEQFTVIIHRPEIIL